MTHDIKTTNNCIFFISHYFVCLPVLLSVCLLLSACGKQQEQQVSGEYVYVTKEISDCDVLFPTDAWSGHYKAEGGYLYYFDASFSLYRVPIGKELDFTAQEMLFSSSRFLEDEAFQEYGDKAFSCFTVDRELNVYLCAYDYDNPSLSLYKYSEEGEQIYCTHLEGEQAYSSGGDYYRPVTLVEQEGNVYVLTTNSLFYVDAEGNFSGKLTLEDSMIGLSVHNSLVKTAQGRIFFFTRYLGRRVYEVVTGNTLQLKPVNELDREYDASTQFEGYEGVLIADADGYLYQYDPEAGTTEAVLRWEDCDIYYQDISRIVQLSEDCFFLLVSDDNWKGIPILLSKVSAEDAPKKEIIVLASFSPSENLKSTVVAFNRSNEQYHVTIENYGYPQTYLYNGQQELEASMLRLDSSLTTKDTPDLLDLSEIPFLSGSPFYKYSEAGVLEDLSPYLERGGGIRKEDFLSNLLEGYTVDGKLLCIPQSFSFLLLYSSDPRISQVENWTLDDLMPLVEEYPEYNLFPSGYMWCPYINETFYSGYYLSEFVDWENGECHFDSDEFCIMLEWIKDYISSDETKESFLKARGISSFEGWQLFLLNHDMDTTRLYGVPSAERAMRHDVSVSNMIGMIANSVHKEGAWAFLQYYYLNGSKTELNGLPTRLDLLKELEQEAGQPIYVYDLNGEKYQKPDGSYETFPRRVYDFETESMVTLHPITQEESDLLWEILYSLNFTPRNYVEQVITEIVLEEAEAFFNGNKTAEETAEVIQGRAQILIQENQ